MPEAPPVTSATLRSRIPAISCFLLPCEKGAGRFDGVSPAVFGRAQNTLRARDALANRDRSSSQSSLAHPREIRTPGSSHCELCLRLFIFQTVPKGRSTKLWREMPSPGQLCRRTVISGTVASFEKLHFVGRFSAFSTTTKPGRSGGWRREWISSANQSNARNPYRQGTFGIRWKRRVPPLCTTLRGRPPSQDRGSSRIWPYRA